MKRPRYWIATTEGSVEITAISEETPGLPSVLCLSDSFQALPLSKAYHEFVRAPTGIIEKLTGKGAFRTDISAPIAQGQSWHLGMCIAHLSWGSRPQNRSFDHIWATGAINPALEIVPVRHIAEKWARSGELITHARLAGEKIDVFLHPENAKELPDTDRDMVRIHPVTHIRDLEKILHPSASGRISKWLLLSRTVLKKRSLAVLAFILLLAGLFAFLPIGRLAAWIDLEEQGRFRELGIELSEARFSDSLFDVNAAYFFSRYLQQRARQNSRAITIEIAQSPEQNNTKCPGSRAVLSDQTSLPEWLYTACNYRLKLKNTASDPMNIWISVISQSADQQVNRHAWQILTLLADEEFDSPPFSISSENDDHIHLVAMITDRPNAEPYRWFNTLNQNPDYQQKISERLFSAGVGLQFFTAIQPDSFSAADSPLPAVGRAQNNPS